MPVERSSFTCFCSSRLIAASRCWITRVRNPLARSLPWNGSPDPHQSPPSHSTGTISSKAAATGQRASRRHITHPAYAATKNHSSGRPSAASAPSTSAWWRCPSRWRSIAPSTSPVLNGSTLPCPRKRNQSAPTRNRAAATPAGQPPKRLAIRNANRTASSPPARAVMTQSPGAASPNSDQTVVNSTGSGFHEDPAVVLRSRCATSLPHTIQDHESCVGTDGSSSDSAASAKQPATSSARVGTRRRLLRGVTSSAAAGAAGVSRVCVKQRLRITPPAAASDRAEVPHVDLRRTERRARLQERREQVPRGPYQRDVRVEHDVVRVVAHARVLAAVVEREALLGDRLHERPLAHVGVEVHV